MATGTQWRPAQSLITLRTQVNDAYPNRNKASDGILGDQAHAATVSDHNPLPNGVVCAIDITHDPNNGCDVQAIADAMAASRDPRIKYLIFNDHILVPNDYGWRWVFHFAGSHRSHLHVSVYGDYDNTNQWTIGGRKTMNQSAAEKTVSFAYRATTNADPTNEQAGYWVPRIRSNPDTVQELVEGLYKANEVFRYKATNYDKDLAKKPSANVTNLPTGETEVTASIPNPNDPKQANVFVRILFNVFGKK